MMINQFWKQAGSFRQYSGPLNNLQRLFYSTEPARNFIDQIVKNNNVVVFMKGTPDRPLCGFSQRVCQILKHQGLKNLTTINVLEDEEIRSTIKEYSSWPTIPQVFIKGNFIGGCDIMQEMFSKGELKQLLRKEGLIDDNSTTTTSSSV